MAFELKLEQLDDLIDNVEKWKLLGGYVNFAQKISGLQELLLDY